ncbi:MAG: hypothetical protein COW13_02560, partial [Candidatus Omnitrophica bacterium CG12_big_fil_rev_8_21_14_0_65_50_5]
MFGIWNIDICLLFGICDLEFFSKGAEMVIDPDVRERVNRYLINQTEFLKVKDTMTEDQLRKFV